MTGDIAEMSGAALLTGNVALLLALGLGEQRPGESVLQAAWDNLTTQEQRVIIALYPPGESGRSKYSQASSLLRLAEDTVRGYEKAALAKLQRFLASPNDWATLPPRVRNALVRAGCLRVDQLTEQLVLELLDGEHGGWGPNSSRALNRLLELRSVPLLQERIPQSYLRTKSHRQVLGLEN